MEGRLVCRCRCGDAARLLHGLLLQLLSGDDGLLLQLLSDDDGVLVAVVVGADAGFRRRWMMVCVPCSGVAQSQLNQEESCGTCVLVISTRGILKVVAVAYESTKLCCLRSCNGFPMGLSLCLDFCATLCLYIPGPRY